MSRLRHGLAAVALAAALVPHQSARAARAVARIERAPAGVVALLGDYGRAWVSHDRALLDRTLAPGKFRDRQLRSHANAASIPFRVFEAAAETHYSGNLASLRVRNKYPGRQVAAYEVTIKNALDVEEKTSIGDGAFTFVREGRDPADRYDGWRLVSDSDMDELAFFTSRFLWDDGPVSVLRSPHFVILAHPGVASSLESLSSVAERSYERAARFWPRPVKTRYAMIVPTTSAELNGIIHDTADIADFVAFVASGIDETRDWEPGAPRVYIHLEHFRRYTPDGQIGILSHELLHAFTRPVTGPKIPTWVEEGLANVAGGLPAYNAKTGPMPTDFPTDSQFVTGGLADIVRHYDQAQVAIEALLKAKGRAAAANFYEKLGSYRVAPGTEDYYIGQVARSTLGWTLPQWIAEWRKALR